jgi:4-amino-4-deoxy-L-arabinose transferase-like glycosyltransferase
MMMQTPDQPPSPPSPLRIFLSSIALLLLFIALLLLFNISIHPDLDLKPPTYLIIAGVIIFLLAEYLHLSPAGMRMFTKLRFGQRGILIAAAVCLTILAAATMVVFMRYGRENYLPVLNLWIAAAGCYLAAFLETIPSRADLRAWWRTHWKECLAAGLLTALAAGLRFYKLAEIPQVINGDEGWLGSIALSTTRPPYANPFALWENFGALYLQTINWAFVFLGVSSFTLRLIPSIAGVLAVPALYLLASRLTNRRTAFLAALLLAMSHSHINFSRSVGVGYIQDTWLVPLELYLLFSGLQNRSRLRAAAGGLLMGMHFSIYLTPQIFAAMLLVFSVLFLLFYRRRYPQAWGILRAFWGGVLIMLLPEVVYSAMNPHEFFSRMNLDGTIQSGWLAAQMAATGRNAAEVLSGRVVHAFLSLIAYPAIDFYGSTIAVLSLFSGVLFLVGLGISLWRTRSEKYLLLNGYFWIGPLAIGLFSVPESADTYRILMILPAAMLMAAIGLDAILDSFGIGWDRKRTAYAATAAFVMVNLFVFNQWTYFVDFAGKCRYGGDSQTRFGSYLGGFLSTVQPVDNVFLLSDTVYWYGTHPSTDFLSGGKAVTNIPEGIDSASPVTGDIIIASPERIDELYAWIHDHPGGKLEARYDCDTLFLLAYHVP